MKRGLKALLVEVTALWSIGYNPCPDEKGTESRGGVTFLSIKETLQSLPR